MDASGAADESAYLRTAKSCGPDASMVGVKFSRSKLLGGDGDNKARSPGRVRSKPLKPSRAGMPGDPGATVVTNARVYYTPRAAAGATGTRHSPRPHWANDFRHDSGAMRRENAEAYLAVIARGKATKQSILTSRLIASRNLSTDGAFARPVGSQSRLTERHHALAVKKASRGILSPSVHIAMAARPPW
jgi:hypothetical protein